MHTEADVGPPIGRTGGRLRNYHHPLPVVETEACCNVHCTGRFVLCMHGVRRLNPGPNWLRGRHGSCCIRPTLIEWLLIAIESQGCFNLGMIFFARIWRDVGDDRIH